MNHNFSSRIVSIMIITLIIPTLVDCNQNFDWVQDLPNNGEYDLRLWTDGGNRGRDFILSKWNNQFLESTKRRMGDNCNNCNNNDQEDGNTLQQPKRLGNRKFQTQGWRRKRDVN